MGYRTEQEAEEAIKYFNKSFMDTCRITCEVRVTLLLQYLLSLKLLNLLLSYDDKIGREKKTTLDTHTIT